MMPSDSCSSQEGQWHPADCAAEPTGIPVQYAHAAHGIVAVVWAHTLERHDLWVTVKTLVTYMQVGHRLPCRLCAAGQ
jgi:hypothetical protein